MVHFSFKGKQNSSKSCLWGTGLAKGESVRGEINVLLKMMSNFARSPGPSEACDTSHMGPISALPPSLPPSVLAFVRVWDPGRERGGQGPRACGEGADGKEEESVKLKTARTRSHAQSLIKGQGRPPCFGINSKHIKGIWTPPQACSLGGQKGG